MDDVQAPALLSQADYARHRGCSPAYISQLKARNDARLVMRGDQVDVAASDAALGEVTEGQSQAPAVPPSNPGTVGAQQRLLEAQAALAEMKVAERAGELIEREAVTRAVADLYTGLKDKLVALPYRIADRLKTLSTEREIATVLATAIEDELALFSQDLAKVTAEMPTDDVQEIPGERRDDGVAGDGTGASPAAAPLPERMGGEVPDCPA